MGAVQIVLKGNVARQQREYGYSSEVCEWRFGLHKIQSHGRLLDECPMRMYGDLIDSICLIEHCARRKAVLEAVAEKVSDVER